MRSFLKTLAMGAILLPSLGLAQTPAPTSSSDALVQARSKYSSSLAELVNALSVNCVSNIVTVVNCDRAFVSPGHLCERKFRYLKLIIWITAV